MMKFNTTRSIQTTQKTKQMLALFCKLTDSNANKVTNKLWHQYILTSLDNLRYLHPHEYEMWNSLQEELDKGF